MLLLEKRRWVQQVFTFRGSVARRIAARLTLVVAVSVFITVLHEVYGMFHISLTPLPFSLIAVALGIFLGFRNNTSYDRFWEGRKLWGALVNTARSTARQMLTLVHSDEAPEQAEALRKELVYRVIAYVHALRHHLRDEDSVDELTALPADEREALRGELNRPIAILQGIADRVAEAYRRGWIHAMHLPVLEASLTTMTDIQGGCERIKSTPIPGSYTLLIHRIVAVYTFGLPFGIVDVVGYYTPLVVLLIAYAFFGLDAVGDEIEDPFGTDYNDLPLAALSTMIEVNLRQRLAETELPPLRQPVGGILS